MTASGLALVAYDWWKNDFLVLIIDEKIPIICFSEKSLFRLGSGFRHLARGHEVVMKGFESSQGVGVLRWFISERIFEGKVHCWQEQNRASNCTCLVRVQKDN